MGILTSLLEDLGSGAINLGFRQFDNFITRKFQEGDYKTAFEAANQYGPYLDQQLSQRGVLPIAGTDQRMQVPQSMGISPATGPIDIFPNNDMLAKVQRSPLASQLVYQQANQAMKYDPYIQQQESQKQTQKAIMDTRAKAAESNVGSRTLGFGDIPGLVQGTVNPTAEQMQQSYATGQGMATTTRGQAQEPFKDTALQRSIQLKRTPGARAIGVGGEGGSQQTISPGFLSSASKSITKLPQYRTEVGRDAQQRPIYELNDRGQRILDIGSQLYQTQKHPNWNAVMGKAVQQETKEFKALQSQTQQQMQTPQGRIDMLRNRPDITPEAQQRLQELQGQVQGQPKQVLPPQGEAQRKASTQTKIDPVIMQKVQDAASLGSTPDEIRKGLKDDGYNPADYGY